MSEQTPRIKASVTHLPGVRRTSSGGPTRPGIEPRVAKLESDVSHIREDVAGLRASIDKMRDQIREDFRILAGMILAVALIMLGALGKGFGWF